MKRTSRSACLWAGLAKKGIGELGASLALHSFEYLAR
jgi:hypothetical protein